MTQKLTEDRREGSDFILAKYLDNRVRKDLPAYRGFILRRYKRDEADLLDGTPIDELRASIIATLANFATESSYFIRGRDKAECYRGPGWSEGHLLLSHTTVDDLTEFLMRVPSQSQISSQKEAT